MGVPFPDIDPYETLGIANTATPEEIKKSYRKLCLKYHPDKLVNLKEELKEEFRLKFEQIQFSHSILNDVKKRKRYDETGSFEDIDGEGDFDWFEYFKNIKVEINEESIKKDKEQYQGSEDEKEDIIESFIESKGDFLYLFESIPHTEVTKDEEARLFKIVEELINDEIIESYSKFDKYKAKRNQNFNKYLKKQLKEEKEAEELKQLMLKKANAKKEDSLQSIILKKRSRDMDGLISNLEAKEEERRSKKGKSKKSKKTVDSYEIDDAEFEALQKKLFKK